MAAPRRPGCTQRPWLLAGAQAAFQRSKIAARDKEYDLKTDPYFVKTHAYFEHLHATLDSQLVNIDVSPSVVVVDRCRRSSPSVVIGRRRAGRSDVVVGLAKRVDDGIRGAMDCVEDKTF